jgi:hypothetical protein
MAHIADFMVDTPSSAGLNNYIARELSPHSSHDAVRPAILCDFQFSDEYIGTRSSPSGREGEVCLEDAPTDRTAQIPTVPHKGQAIDNGGTEECGCRAITTAIDDHGAKWEHREGPITTRHCTATEAQRADSHPEKESECARAGSNDHSSGGSHGFP